MKNADEKSLALLETRLQTKDNFTQQTEKDYIEAEWSEHTEKESFAEEINTTQKTKVRRKIKIKFFIIPFISLLVIIIFFMTIFLIFGNRREEIRKAEKARLEAIKNQPVWAYCLIDPAGIKKSRCAEVEKIIFDEHGNLMRFIVFNKTKGLRIDFWKIPFRDVGEYSRPGETGTWFLKKTSDGVYDGWEENEEGKQMIATLQITKPIK